MRGQQARGKLYARRPGGDLDLGLEPSRVKQFGLNKCLQDTARIITPGGLLPGGVWQDICTLSETQNFRIGARMAMDERVFRYAKVGDCTGSGALWEAGIGRPLEAGTGMSPTCTCHEKTFNSGYIETAEEGAYTITVDWRGALVADAYEGGWFSMQAGGSVWSCRILGNDAAIDTTPIFLVTFYLEAPLPININNAGDRVVFTENEYNGVIRHSGPASDVWQSVVGIYMPFSAEDVDGEDQFTWLQTWGPLARAAIEWTHEGGATMQRSLYFAGGGCLQALPDCSDGLIKAAIWATCPQVAGFYLPEIVDGQDYGPANDRQPIVFLTICP